MMVLITSSVVATIAGVVWKYWRIPKRLWQWRFAKAVEPAVGQLWREAGLSGPDSEWKIVEVTDYGLDLKSTTDKDDFGDNLTASISWEVWERDFIKKRRFYCVDKDQSVEDQFWGDASED